MTYMIHLEHSEDKCQSFRSQFEEKMDCYVTCNSGEHSAYCFTEAMDKSEAEKYCASDFGGDCRVFEVDHFGGKGHFEAGKKEYGYGQESGTMQSGYGQESEKKEFGYGSKEYGKGQEEEKKY